MTSRLTAWFPVALLAILAAVTFWLDREVQPPEAAADSKTRHDPDYIVENFSATRVGPDGRAQHTLHAKRMAHYPDDDTTHLEAPRLVSFRGKAEAVTVTAKKALLSGDGENAYLSDEVRLVRSARDKNSELIVETTWLHVMPEAHIAQTDREVKIYDANMLITAVGLELNSETRILKLLSNVRGRYEKKRPAR
ncbi:MAG: LPS export ABC transporter periplasmic protein LptC [Betaproteobacteria bacterium]|jgi:lipopolysaccharide export system protein LptC|nr:LPS export ABC transporter periplasmic protein LptC [Betaproteobacteria bacterium]